MSVRAASFEPAECLGADLASLVPERDNFSCSLPCQSVSCQDFSGLAPAKPAYPKPLVIFLVFRTAFHKVHKDTFHTIAVLPSSYL